MDGTASLANREIGRALRANCRKMLFSGAVKHRMKPQLTFDLTGRSKTSGWSSGNLMLPKISPKAVIVDRLVPL
jgi:hypothetical protein